ncbi:hypothetical protein BDV41DRAFT_529398 [Aspergillus transmontanensis]|uniref:Uncharacterized protein n=1 Tax=Aspergillus transmontanensis TaxID=1034304 RepID=A0A5N6W4W4_9EURO|nr:hypothetical protein BDV41DRAFT_529398 [Aspergillus transmontanensis]
MNIYAADKQDILTSAARNATQFSAPPPLHLSRALYIPHHDSTTRRLSVYDTSSQYSASAGGLPIGSSQYVVALGLMQKPQAEGTFLDSLAYTVDFRAGSHGNAGVIISVQHYSFSSISLSSVIGAETTDNNATLLIPRAGVHSIPEEFPMATSYPIPSLETRDGIFKQPYFTFQIPSEDGEKKTTFEWQVHPLHTGRMRYTLVRVPSRHHGIADPDPLDIVAIYHHIGVGASLSLPYSEGILLVPHGMNHKTEAMVVGSALGMLWRLRKLRREAQVSWRGSRYSKIPHFGSIKSFLGRKK